LDKKICDDYTDDYVFRKGKKKKICRFFDLNTNALCQHENHIVCLFYFKKHNINDPWLRNLMDDFGLVLVRSKK
jgi:chemotaxis methyl-accepting protein methylase